MKNRNVKVIDEHNIDRNANVMFAIDLEGSEYVVYWIERDEESNNVFISKVLKNIDGTYNMINIDDADKKKDVSDIVKTLISTSVSDQNDKMVGTTLALSNGKVVRFIDVLFNKEQNINVSKTYITTVKKEVTKVAENYYDVVVEEAKVANVLPSVTPVVEKVEEIFPTLGTSEVSAPVDVPVVTAAPVVETPQVVQPVVTQTESVVASVPKTEPVVVEPLPVITSVVEPTPVAVTPAPVSASEPTVLPVQAEVQQPVVAPAIPVEPTPVIPTPVVAAPQPEPVVVAAPVSEVNQPLVFNATKETNLNAALGEVANSAAIPVENITPVREFGIEQPVVQAVPQQPVVTPVTSAEPTGAGATNVGKAGFANSKFFMVVAIAFFLASCIFLGYEVFNYFQLVK